MGLEIFVIVFLVVGVIAFVAYPLFRPAEREQEVSPHTLDTLIAQRNAVYETIRDLDFDYQLGKLSPGDYDALRDKYKARAAAVLQEIDAAMGSNGAPAEASPGDAASLDAQIEAQVAQRRGAPRLDGDDAIEQEVARRRATAGRCRNCGTPYHAGDRFCGKCGNAL